MWYQWIFFDEDLGSFHFIEGTNLYEVNKRAYEEYKYYLPVTNEDIEYLHKYCSDWTTLTERNSWERNDFFDFCLNKPWYVPSPDHAGVSIEFRTINFANDNGNVHDSNIIGG